MLHTLTLDVYNNILGLMYHLAMHRYWPIWMMHWRPLLTSIKNSNTPFPCQSNQNWNEGKVKLGCYEVPLIHDLCILSPRVIVIHCALLYIIHVAYSFL